VRDHCLHSPPKALLLKLVNKLRQERSAVKSLGVRLTQRALGKTSQEGRASGGSRQRRML